MSEENKTLIKHFFEQTSDLILNFHNANNSDVKKVVEETKKMMKNSKNWLTYTQLRNIYHLFKIEDLDFKKLQLTRHKLAYIEARLDSDEGKLFVQRIDNLIEKIDSENNTEIQIKNFLNFMESIVAYHKLNA